MKCLECNKRLSFLEHRKSMETLGVELCVKHQERIKYLIKEKGTSIEAIQLYYGLKEAGVNPMLEWWDGKKSVDIAISRVKLNIQIDSEYHRLTHEQAMNNLERTMYSFKDGFTTIRIPHFLVTHYPKETVDNIIGIMEGLKANLKVI